MRLILHKSVRAEMRRAARAVAPLEACGLLAGESGRATKCYSLANADASGEHYRMLPEEQFAAVKEMRAGGQKLLAVWHSHPASPARMSAEDLRLAYTPDVVYVVLSLACSQESAIRGFLVNDGVAEEVEIEFEEEAL